MKKLVSTGLSVAIAISVCNTKTYAWEPTDFTDPKCIDVRKLGVNTDYITKNKVCGCKTCSVDAVIYNRLGDYLTDLENRFDSISKEENYIENKVKRSNIKLIVEAISRAIDRKDYKNGNFLLASTNYDPNYPSATAFFTEKDDIIYRNNYDETYFAPLNDRLKTILSKIQNHNKLRKDSPTKINYAEQHKEDAKILATCLGVGTVVALTTVFGQSISNKISEFFNNKPNNINELIEIIKKLPEKEQNIIKKKILKYLDKETDVTEENLKKLPNKVIKELLKEAKKLEAKQYKSKN